MLCLLLAAAGAGPALWLGLERGPIPPAAAERAERALVEALDLQEQLTDPSGRPLGAEGRKRVEAQVAALRDAGVDAFLRFDAAGARRAFAAARERFVTELGGEGPLALYADILLAEAEAALQREERGLATQLLLSLLPFGPAAGPSPERAPAELLAAWRRLEPGPSGFVHARCAPRCELWLDGEPAGTSDERGRRLGPLIPGEHLLTARWPGARWSGAAPVPPGATTDLDLRAPPETEAAGDAVHRFAVGLAASAPEAAPSLGAREASGYFAVVRPGPKLVLGVVDKDGYPIGAAPGPVTEDKLLLAELIRRATVFPDPGAWKLAPDRFEPRREQEEPGPGWPWWVWGAVGALVAGGVVAGVAAATATPEGVTTVRVEFR